MQHCKSDSPLPRVFRPSTLQTHSFDARQRRARAARGRGVAHATPAGEALALAFPTARPGIIIVPLLSPA